MVPFVMSLPPWLKIGANRHERGVWNSHEFKIQKKKYDDIDKLSPPPAEPSLENESTKSDSEGLVEFLPGNVPHR